MFALPVFLPSVISSFFTQNRGDGPPGPYPRSATALTRQNNYGGSSGGVKNMFRCLHCEIIPICFSLFDLTKKKKKLEEFGDAMIRFAKKTPTF